MAGKYRSAPPYNPQVDFFKQKNDRPRPHPVRGTLFFILLAIIGALAARVYLMEAYAIPSGSMAPTLLGDHRHAVCPACGHGFDVDGALDADGAPYGRTGLMLHCPLCSTGVPVPKNLLGGDRLMVSKFPARPNRWDVVVFRNPQETDPLSSAPGPNGFFIKRVVGLPGEDLHLLDGHVFVRKQGETDFHIARRADPQENKHWESVARSAWRDIRTVKNPPAEWSFDFGESPENMRPAYDDATLHPYNQFRQGLKHLGTECIQDLRLAGRAENGSGTLAFSTCFATADRLALDLAPGGRLRLTGNGRVLRETALAPGRPVTLELWLLDHEALAFADGRCVLRHAFNLPWKNLLGRPAPPSFPEIIETSGHFSSVSLSAAIPYLAEVGPDPARGGLTRNGAGKIIMADPVTLPDGSGQPQACWFCVGDNSPASTDSRFWNSLHPEVRERMLGGHRFEGLVPEGLMVGRAWGVAWPADEEGAAWKPEFPKMRRVR